MYPAGPITTQELSPNPVEAIPPTPTLPQDTGFDMFDYARVHPLTIHAENLADKLGILEPIEESRVGQYVTGLVARLHTTANAIDKDITNSEHPGADKWIRRSMWYSQIADRGRLAMILASNAAIDAFTWSHDGRWAGAAAGGVFAGWSLVIGESLNQNFNRLPETVATIQEEFPVAVDLMADALPGSRKSIPVLSTSETQLTPEVQNQDVEELGFAGRALRKVKIVGGTKAFKIASLPARLPLMALRRGFSSVNFGATAYVSTTKFKGGSEKDVRIQTANVMAYGGAFVFGLAWAVCERIDNLADDGKFEEAQDLLDFVSNDWNWLKLGAASIALELGMAKMRKRKLLKEGLITDSNESTIANPVIG